METLKPNVPSKKILLSLLTFVAVSGVSDGELGRALAPFRLEVAVRAVHATAVCIFPAEDRHQGGHKDSGRGGLDRSSVNGICVCIRKNEQLIKFLTQSYLVSDLKLTMLSSSKVATKAGGLSLKACILFP